MKNETNRLKVSGVLTDSLGYLRPKCTLSAEANGTWDPSLKEWVLNSTVDAVGRGRYRWPDYTSAKKDLEAAGFSVPDCPEKFDARMCHLAVVHKETQTHYDAAKAASDKKWLSARPCFVRYGRLPQSGRSTNHIDGTPELGVSVFRGLLLESGEARAIPGNHVEQVSMHLIMDRPLYLVEGKEVGVGADGEPVLVDAIIVREVK